MTPKTEVHKTQHSEVRPPRSQHFAESAVVLDGFPTKTGEPSSFVFGDDTWLMGEAVLAPNLEGVTYPLSFGGFLTHKFSLSLKEFALARLRFRAKTFGILKPQSSFLYTSHLMRVLADIHDHEAIECLGDIDQPMLDRWLTRGQAVGSPVEKGVFVLQCLHAYSQYITYPLLVHPWRGRGTRRVTGVQVGRKNSENTTPRIPESVAGPLLQWALRYVDQFSDEIIAAVARGRTSDALLQPDSSRELLDSPPHDRLALFLIDLETSRRGLPSISPSLPTDAGFLKLLGNRRKRLSSGWIRKRERDPHYKVTDQQLLVASHEIVTALRLPHLETVYDQLREGAGTLWLDWQVEAASAPESLTVLRRGTLRGKVLQREVEMLIAAAYIVVGYLSGMRDSEVQSLRRGCLVDAMTADGISRRWKVKGLVYKHRRSAGDPEQWVVIEPTARAIQALERLHVAAGSAQDCFLFRKHVFSIKDLGKNLPLGPGFVKRLNDFIAHVNALATRSQALSPVPNWQGRPWQLTTRQFRRTLAWHIVNQPFGTVAGMIHFKLLHLHIMEGYGGMSDSGFEDEVAQERALGNLQSLVQRHGDWRAGVRLGGPGAAALEREFASTLDSASEGPMVADEARHRELLRSRAKSLYPGLLNDCFFDPSTAKCGGQTGPILDSCRPTECSNSILGEEHRIHWIKHGEELSSYLKDRARLPKAQLIRIEEAQAKVKAVVSPPRKHAGRHE